jgi:hypothetical protein
MPSVDRDSNVENPFPGSEKPSSCEGITLSISPLNRQIETPYSSQNESRI